MYSARFLVALTLVPVAAHDACIDSIAMKAAMAQLTVRQVDDRVVQRLRERAAKNNRSAEAEHREILQAVLLQDERARAEFVERATKLRARLRSSKDSTSLIRKDRDRDTPR